MRDRLITLECPSNMINQIGGWTKEGVGEDYGDGHTLAKMFLCMDDSKF